MANINAHDAMRELTVMLIYLSRFSQGEKYDEATDFYAWKGYNFDILNELSDAHLTGAGIPSGKGRARAHPRRPGINTEIPPAPPCSSGSGGIFGFIG